MAPASLYAHARSNRRRLIRLLSSVALLPCMIVSAHAQTAAPSITPGGAGSETRTMDGTTTPGPDGGAGIGLPTIRLSGFRFTATGSLTETYTTNSLGIPDSAVAGYSGSDLVTTATLALNLHDHTPRLDADFAYSLAALHYLNNPDFDRLSHFLTALATADLIRNRLQFTASAFASPILINGLGPQSAAATNTGIRDTYGYTLYPDLTFRFGQFARSETILTQSSVFFVEPNGPKIDVSIPGALPVPDQVISYGATERISSGPDFFRLNWVLTGSVNKTTQADVDFTAATSTANIRYAFTRAIIVTSLVGYQSFTSNQTLSRSLEGPTATGGLQYRPSADFQASASAGWAFNSPSYSGDLRYQLGAFTSLVGSVTDTVTTPGDRLLGNLANLGVNANGDFINTGLVPNPGAAPGLVTGVSGFNPALLDGTSLTSSIVRYRYANLSLLHISDRTQYRLTGFHTQFDTLTEVTTGFSQEGDSTGLDLTISRNMTPLLVSAVSANVSSVNDLGGNYKTYQINLNVNYALSPFTQVFFSTSYSHRSSETSLAASSPLSGDYSDARVTVGINRRFF